MTEEQCTCGHKRSEHDMSHFAQAIGMSEEQAKELGLDGHGQCTICKDCPKFTFLKFLGGKRIG